MQMSEYSFLSGGISTGWRSQAGQSNSDGRTRKAECQISACSMLQAETRTGHFPGQRSLGSRREAEILILQFWSSMT
jgi:hypothetical protein